MTVELTGKSLNERLYEYEHEGNVSYQNVNDLYMKEENSGISLASLKQYFP